jgi:hypothetical protein
MGRHEADLMEAASAGELEGVERAIARGAKVSACDDAALCAAAMAGSRKVVERLLGFEPDRRSLDEALVIASTRGHGGVADLLLTAGADTGLRGGMALRLAAQGGFVAIVERLLRCGSPGASEALAQACMCGHSHVVELLLAAGADPRAHGDDALVCASRWGHLDLVERLLQLGCNPRAQRDKPIIWACRRGFLQVVEMLIAAGADPIGNGDLVVLAAEAGQLAVFDRLVELGADPRVMHDAPLLAAARSGHLRVAERALEYGADAGLCLRRLEGYGSELVRDRLQKATYQQMAMAA